MFYLRWYLCVALWTNCESKCIEQNIVYKCHQLWLIRSTTAHFNTPYHEYNIRRRLGPLIHSQSKISPCHLLEHYLFGAARGAAAPLGNRLSERPRMHSRIKAACWFGRFELQPGRKLKWWTAGCWNRLRTSVINACKVQRSELQNFKGNWSSINWLVPVIWFNVSIRSIVKPIRKSHHK